MCELLKRTTKLELVYNSQRGDGPLGVGWALSGLSAITRCPQTMAQDGVRGAVNYDGGDRFCLDSQRLVPPLASDIYGTALLKYRTEMESYKTVMQVGKLLEGDPTGPVLFQATTKERLWMYYGGTDNSRVQVNGKATNVAWLLSTITDSVTGNRYDITYSKDIANGVAYPTRIDYTLNSTTGLQAANSVLFDYEARAQESPPFTYHAGSQLGRYILRLAKIRTVTDAGARAVMEYRLGYGISPSTGRSRIESITQCTAAGQCLPATTFAFAAPEATVRLSNASVPAFATDSLGQTLMGDYDGDGRTDLLFYRPESSNGVSMLFANGDGTWRQVPARSLEGVGCCPPEAAI